MSLAVAILSLAGLPINAWPRGHLRFKLGGLSEYLTIYRQSLAGLSVLRSSYRGETTYFQALLGLHKAQTGFDYHNLLGFLSLSC